MERRARNLDPTEESELDTLFLAGLELLPIENQEQPDFIVVAIHLLLEAIRMGEPLPKALTRNDFCSQLGAVYGEQICLQFGWDWLYLMIEGKYEGAAVANPERTRVLFPIMALYQWGKEGVENRCLHLFKEIANQESSTGFQILH